MARAFQCDVCGRLYTWTKLDNIDPLNNRETSETPTDVVPVLYSIQIDNLTINM